MLTDEEGTATDFYTYDAFGNLTEKLGNTENSYLYRGEQLDSFTSLYYLRARYMNPSTGTFITMDEYAGSVFEPVSLHKYLYANANPVMNSDPTGYFTLAEFSVANAISETLNKVYTSNMMGTLNGMLNALIASLSGCTQEEVQDAFNRGFFDGFMMGGGYAALAQLAGCIPFLKLAVASIDIYWAAGDFQAAREAWDEKHYILAAVYGASGIVGMFSAFKTLMQTCFTGDTLVAVEDGQKRIDEIEVGDKVWAYNVETGETELKSVTKVYVHSVDEILHLYTDEDNIDTTANHPFYVIGKGWVAAGDLVEGDKVYNLDGSTSTVIGSRVEKLDEPVHVYNLEVEDFHSYFVGCVPILVHNYQAGDKTPNGWELTQHAADQLNNDGRFNGNLSLERLDELASSPNLERFIDARTNNINVYVASEFSQGSYLRITVPLDGMRIVSIGFNGKNQITNLINRGILIRL